MADHRTDNGEDRAGAERWFAMAALAVAILCVLLGALAARIVAAQDKATDFVSYWAAARLALAGTAAEAYDIAAHRAVELTAVELGGLMSFPYPPPFLFFVAPIGTLGYGAAFATWVAATALLYAAASLAITRLRYALAQPAAFANAISGQNGFLTTAILIAGLTQLEKRPFLAGAILGLLVIKPQLALLLPVALIAARAWRSIAGGALSAAACTLLALAVFGREAFDGFFGILPLYTSLMAREAWPWNEFASTFAMLRHIGIGQAAAMTVHAIVAVGAAVLTWRAWRRREEARVPILAAASLLVPPYTLTYDALFLMIPFAWFVRERRFGAAALLWLLGFLPVLTYFKLYPGPTTIPLAAVLCLVLLQRRRG